MLRIFLQFILPLFFPTVLFLVWTWFEKRRRQNPSEAGRETPWIWLIGIGFALSIISLVTWGFIEGDEPNTTYSAPRLENGTVVPGTFK